MKVELKLGEVGATAEGSLEEVMQVLDQYWPTLFDVAKFSTQASVITYKTRKGTRKPNAATSSPKAIVGNETEANDAEQLANTIKSDDRFGAIKKKILDVPGKWLEKSKFVALMVDGKITSGDVKRVFDELKIKTDLPTISKALSNNSTQFITSGSSPKFYEMTLATKESFEAWLFGDEE